MNLPIKRDSQLADIQVAIAYPPIDSRPCQIIGAAEAAASLIAAMAL